jgi:hypothetical protein
LTAALPLALPIENGLVEGSSPLALKLISLGRAVVGVTAVVATLLLPVAGRIADPRTVALEVGSGGRVVDEVDAEVMELEATCFPIDLLRFNKLSEGNAGRGGGKANAGIVECRMCGRGNSMGVRSPPSSL